jgi:hypothetical protein
VIAFFYFYFLCGLQDVIIGTVEIGTLAPQFRPVSPVEKLGTRPDTKDRCYLLFRLKIVQVGMLIGPFLRR